MLIGYFRSFGMSLFEEVELPRVRFHGRDLHLFEFSIIF